MEEKRKITNKFLQMVDMLAETIGASVTKGDNALGANRTQLRVYVWALNSLLVNEHHFEEWVQIVKYNYEAIQNKPPHKLTGNVLLAYKTILEAVDLL